MKPSPSRVASQWFSHREGSVNPLDLQRLAVRIETLQRKSTYQWHPGDDMEFKNLLPGGRGRQVLPDPEWLREKAVEIQAGTLSDDDKQALSRDWRLWITWALRAEGLIRDNDPRNPKRMIRDMARGKYPGMF
jgi:hypothetical protein